MSHLILTDRGRYFGGWVVLEVSDAELVVAGSTMWSGRVRVCLDHDRVAAGVFVADAPQCGPLDSLGGMCLKDGDELVSRITTSGLAVPDPIILPGLS